MLERRQYLCEVRFQVCTLCRWQQRRLDGFDCGTMESDFVLNVCLVEVSALQSLQPGQRLDVIDGGGVALGRQRRSHVALLRKAVGSLAHTAVVGGYVLGEIADVIRGALRAAEQFSLDVETVDLNVDAENLAVVERSGGGLTRARQRSTPDCSSRQIGAH